MRTKAEMNQLGARGTMTSGLLACEKGRLNMGISHVVSLHRYPVKSMMGEELNATEVDEFGLLGDRAYAIVDSSDGR